MNTLLFILLVAVPIIKILIVLVVIGVILYFVNTRIPMAAWMKTVINVVVALLVILWLLGIFGITNMTIDV